MRHLKEHTWTYRACKQPRQTGDPSEGKRFHPGRLQDISLELVEVHEEQGGLLEFREERMIPNNIFSQPHKVYPPVLFEPEDVDETDASGLCEWDRLVERARQ